MTAPGDDRAGPTELQPLFSAIFDAAMDAVVTIDHYGRVLG
ncbi:hypothetical protein ABIB25_004665 [Nakamurella sp. UYEF19]